MTNKTSPKLSAERYVARLNAAKAMLARDYCNIFTFWRTCPLRRCRKARLCSGDQNVCLKRIEREVSRDIQWRARQQMMASTPANAGPPERMAREFPPGSL